MQKGVMNTEPPYFKAFSEKKFREKVSFFAAFYMKKAVVFNSLLCFYITETLSSKPSRFTTISTTNR